MYLPMTGKRELCRREQRQRAGPWSTGTTQPEIQHMFQTIFLAAMITISTVAASALWVAPAHADCSNSNCD